MLTQLIRGHFAKQLVASFQEISCFRGTGWFITEFTKACYWSLP